MKTLIWDNEFFNTFMLYCFKIKYFNSKSLKKKKIKIVTYY